MAKGIPVFSRPLILSVVLLLPTIAGAQGSIVAWGDDCEVPEPNAGFVSVVSSCGSPNADYYLALGNNGSIVAWGDNQWGQCDIPLPNMNFVAIAAGAGHNLGLKTDGTIVAWGRPSDGACDVPEPNSDFIAIAAAGLEGMMDYHCYHSLGLKADGSIVAWGNNQTGQCNVPEPNADFVAITAGYTSFPHMIDPAGYSMGLKSDGSIVFWGYPGTNDPLNDIPEPNSGFVAIDSRAYNALALRADGTIEAWGPNVYGECDVPEPNANFIAISQVQNGGLGLKDDGSVVAWGYYSPGWPGPPPPDGYMAIEAGNVCNLAISGSVADVHVGTPGHQMVLGQNVPNPFNPQTTITFEIPERQVVTLRVFDMAGRLVRELIIAEPRTPGRHEMVWNGMDETGRQVASGTYFYRLEAGSYSETKRMVLIK